MAKNMKKLTNWEVVGICASLFSLVITLIAAFLRNEKVFAIQNGILILFFAFLSGYFFYKLRLSDKR